MLKIETQIDTNMRSCTLFASFHLLENQNRNLNISISRSLLFSSSSFNFCFLTGAASTTTASSNSMDFHILVEDGDGEILLHHERFRLSKRDLQREHSRVFQVRMLHPTPPQYYIHVVSDRFLHSHTTVPIGKFSSFLSCSCILFNNLFLSFLYLF